MSLLSNTIRRARRLIARPSKRQRITATAVAILLTVGGALTATHLTTSATHDKIATTADTTNDATSSSCPPEAATCSPIGAFQADDPVGPPVPGDPTHDQVILAEAASAEAAFQAASLPNALHFYQHYLDASGTDLNFDASVPYQQVQDFADTVDTTVKQQINTRDSGQTSFDSGWLNYTFPGKYSDWHNAVGHGFYRVTGQQQNPVGSWAITLQLTSYYQFRENQQFLWISGKDMVRLTEIGKAKNFRSIGRSTHPLMYDPNGNPAPTIPTPYPVSAVTPTQ